MTCADVARALGCSISKGSRMETGARGLYPDEVAAYLGMLHVPSALREELLALVRDCATPNWWQPRAGTLPTLWPDLMLLEADATTLHNYEPLAIPGLLQIPEYTRAVIKATIEEITEAEVDRLVAARIARQIILTRHQPLRLEVILDEAVLRRPVGGPQVMARQLRSLAESADKPNVSIQVVPFAAGASPGLTGPFLILDYADQSSLVYLEHRDNTAFLEEESHIRLARMDLRRLRSLAMPTEESARFVIKAADQLTMTREE